MRFAIADKRGAHIVRQGKIVCHAAALFIRGNSVIGQSIAALRHISLIPTYQLDGKALSLQAFEICDGVTDRFARIASRPNFSQMIAAVLMMPTDFIFYEYASLIKSKFSLFVKSP